MKRLIGALALALIVSTSPDLVIAASFDCSMASAGIETAICNDDTVSAADEELARIYESVRLQDTSVVEQQQAWLSQVRNVCADSECLATAYLDRISVLESRLAQLASAASGASVEKAKSPTLYPTSFDCSAGINAAQQTVCTDPTLAVADVELASLIRRWAETTSYDAAAQGSWIKNVRDRCATADCLSSAYLERIEHLEQIIRNAASVHEPEAERATATDRMVTAAPLSSVQIQTRWQRFSLALWGIGLFFVIMLALGASKKLVICYGFADLVWTIVPMIALGACGAAFSFGHSWAEMGINLQLLAVLSGALGTYAVARNFLTSIQYNRSLIAGLLVGIFKLLLGFVAFVIMLGALGGSDDRKSGGGSVAGFIIGLLFCYWLYGSIVNGPDVYEAKGWDGGGT